VTQQAARGDRHVYGAISRFLPPVLHGLFEQVGPAAAGVEGSGSDTAPASVDIAARVRSRWS
jgi:DNA helicase-2/ATP-dependent DNA helicase PcrA